MKIHTTLSVDKYTLERAKTHKLNLSGEFEKFLRNKMPNDRKDVPEDLKVIRCSVCTNETDDFFYCSEGKRIFCVQCHKSDNMSLHCKPYFDKFGEHVHFRIPGHENQNFELKKELEKHE